MDGAPKIRLIQDFGDVDLIHTDRKKLAIILSNLLSNSIKYHNHHNNDPWIKISVEPNKSEILVHVADNGSGIPAQHQHKIFDMFYRAHESSVGSGLGLFIVKETIAQLNGGITLQSIQGKGSSFTVALPKLANA
jgi:signal transduction histidine kinase